MKPIIGFIFGALSMYVVLYNIDVRSGQILCIALGIIGTLLVLIEGIVGDPPHPDEFKPDLDKLIDLLARSANSEADPATRGSYLKDRWKYEKIRERKGR